MRTVSPGVLFSFKKIYVKKIIKKRMENNKKSFFFIIQNKKPPGIPGGWDIVY